VFTEPLPRNGKGDTHADTQKVDLINLLLVFQHRESRLKIPVKNKVIMRNAIKVVIVFFFLWRYSSSLGLGLPP
jgi:hypothetical protein